MANMEVVSEKIESTNRALALEAFDTLFNKRDYAAPERCRRKMRCIEIG
jgi:hypothetical protein